MIKKLLYRILGPSAYLRVVSRTFFFLLNGGWLRNQPAFFNHYMIRELVKEGDVVIDIGANLGYYTVPLSDLCGKEGKVIAVEPVELFRNVLIKNLGSRRNVEVLACALGEEDGKEIEMGIPSGHKNFRHGLTHVLAPGERDAQTMVFKAVMRDPRILFSSLDRLDLIKCDVEGYEIHIIPLLQSLLVKFKPIVQLETGGVSREKMLSFFGALNYLVLAAGERSLRPLTQENAMAHPGDLLFIPKEKLAGFKNIISP